VPARVPGAVAPDLIATHGAVVVADPIAIHGAVVAADLVDVCVVIEAVALTAAAHLARDHAAGLVRFAAEIGVAAGDAALARGVAATRAVLAREIGVAHARAVA